MTAPGYVAAKLVGGDMGILPEASTLGEGEGNSLPRPRDSDDLQFYALVLSILHLLKQRLLFICLCDVDNT